MFPRNISIFFGFPKRATRRVVFIIQWKTMTSVMIKFPVASFRRINSPVDEKLGRAYMAVVNIKNLPKELESWRELNPREPNLFSGVSNKIRKTLEEAPEFFVFRNRGITLLAEQVSFNSSTEWLQIELNDTRLHGLLDGGHTFSVIRDFVDSLDTDDLPLPAFVKLEVLEGIKDRNEVIHIVEARNTSTQVKEQSINELKNTFEAIHNVLRGKPYADRIAYKEYELLSDGSKKDIDIKEILSYLVCFDVETFDGSKHPIKAYSTKSSLVGYFSDRKDEMTKYVALLPEILELRDAIYLELPDAYNKSANNEGGGKFGKLTGVTDTSGKPRMDNVILEYTGKESHYRIPSGFIYPILASFRNLIGIHEGKCYWKTDPIRMFNELKFDLAARVGRQAKELRNPNKLGKDVATWQSCYDALALEVLRRKLS